MASVKTQAQYLAAGLTFLARAREQFSGLTDIEALCSHAEARTEIVKGTSVNLYRQQYRAALRHLAANRGHPSAEIEAYRTRIEAALAKVRGRPPSPNTATKKIKTAQDWMVKSVFGRLKQKAIHHDRIRLAATALFCLLQPILGTRPIELQHTRIEGDVLIVLNAKRADGSSRGLNLADVHPIHRMALLVLIEIIKVEIADVGYERWLKTLAENLARACEAASTRENPIPRLAPSSFRHTAISTWAAAGFSVEEIAEMAGHLSLLSARRHYIHQGAGWAQRHAGGIRPVVLLPEPDRSQVELTVSDELLILDDFPVPPNKPAENIEGNNLWAEHVERFDREYGRSVRPPSDPEMPQQPSRRRST